MKAALQQSGVDRKDLFIISRVYHGAETTSTAATAEFDQLVQHLDYVDLAFQVGNVVNAAKHIAVETKEESTSTSHTVEAQQMSMDLFSTQWRQTTDLQLIVGISPFSHAGNGDVAFVPHVQFLSKALGVTAHQLLLAHALTQEASATVRTTALLPIPCTCNVSHLEENFAAQQFSLQARHVNMLDGLVALADPCPTREFPQDYHLPSFVCLRSRSR